MSCDKYTDHPSIEASPTGDDAITPTLVTAPCITPYTTPCPSPCPQLPASGCAPYYTKAGMCLEDNSKTAYLYKISGAFKTAAGTAMPACGAKVRVMFENVVDVPIGANLWAQGIGFLKITGYNSQTNEIEVENECPSTSCDGEGNAAPGTPIPACTVFALDAPNCSNVAGVSGSSFPYLNAGFTAPADGNCIDISATNVNGLSVGKNVGISTGTYRISAILSSTLLTICNDGAGITPGTVVEYQDGAGNLIVPLGLIDSNPCTTPGVLSGALLSCKNNIQQPLIGGQDGQVPVYTAATGEVDFRTLGIPTLDCTILIVGLTTDPGFPVGTSYLVQVATTADFAPGLTITIQGEPFIIDTVDNGTQLHATPVTHPAIIHNYPVNTPVCSASCCEDNAARITILEDLVINNLGSGGGLHLWADQNIADAVDITPVTISAAGASVAGNNAVLTFFNNSGDYNMGTLFHMSHTFVFNLLGTAGQVCDITFFNDWSAQVGIVAGALLPSKALPNVYQFASVPSSFGINRHSFHFEETISRVVVPNSSFTVAARGRLQLNGNDLATGVNVLYEQTRLTALGVAVR